MGFLDAPFALGQPRLQLTPEANTRRAIDNQARFEFLLRKTGLTATEEIVVVYGSFLSDPEEFLAIHEASLSSSEQAAQRAFVWSERARRVSEVEDLHQKLFWLTAEDSL